LAAPVPHTDEEFDVVPIFHFSRTDRDKPPEATQDAHVALWGRGVARVIDTSTPEWAACSGNSLSIMLGTLVLLRHGQSTWNQLNLFTGWHDVDLTDQGVAEASGAGRTMAEAGLRFDVAHTSLLTRAVRTTHLALDAMGQVWLPVQRHWRLNERHYGALQGLDKKATTERHGAEQTHTWRRSFEVPPPPVDATSPEHPLSDPRYRLLPPDVLPATECLKDVVARVLPYWYDVVAPQLLAGLDVLVGAHGNSLRALMMHLESIGTDDIAELNVPTGVPRRYEFDDTLTVRSAEYLGDQGAIAAAAAAVAAQAGGR
jgi:2,3-bisphosphoglycerate-dependent phosphoglycerate mutase